MSVELSRLQSRSWAEKMSIGGASTCRVNPGFGLPETALFCEDDPVQGPREKRRRSSSLQIKENEYRWTSYIRLDSQ